MSNNPTTIFPSITPDSDDEFVDDTYGEREVKRMKYDRLRSIAAEHPDDDVHGRMSKDDLQDALVGKERV